MNVVLVVNPKSGKGRAAAVSAALLAALPGRGHAVQQITPGATTDALTTQLARFDAALIVGGDGSVHHALPALVASGTPVYHVPLGTENLFARAFGMSRHIEHVAAALDRASIIRIDVGTCKAHAPTGTQDAMFAVMCSLGPDASVIHRLHRVRNGPISHLSYARPCLAESIAPRFAKIALSLDGGPRREGLGMLVVANLKEYALHINPATTADPADARLDAVFMPARTGVGMVARLARAWFGQSPSDDLRPAAALGTSVTYALARTIEIETPGTPVQLDGEAFMDAARHLSIAVLPAALRVLLPANRHATGVRAPNGDIPVRPPANGTAPQ